MREIKFRYYVSYNDLMKYSDAFDDLVQFFAAYRQADRNNANPILMQHTGLKDSEGNCIYEGDILARDGFPNAKVYFHDLRWYPAIDSNYHVVIGNLYQNPELLNDPQNKTIRTD